MVVLFHQAPLSEFLALVPILRGIVASGQKLTVVATWSRAHLSVRLLGASPMDIEMFEFTRLHVEGGPSRVSPAVSDLFSSASHVLSYISDGRDAWAENVQRLAPNAQTLFLDPSPKGQNGTHLTDLLLADLEAQNYPVQPLPAEPVANSNGPMFVHPGSTTPAKCWPAEQYRTLLQELRNRGMQASAVIGEIELERWPEAEVKRWQDDCGAVLCRSVDELADTFASAKLVVGNDAAPVHLAAELGVPTLSLFGPSDPKRWAPRGPGSAVLAPSGGATRMDWLAVQSVIEAIEAQSG